MVMNSRQRATLAALCPSVRWEVSMASHSTFRAGGVVEAMVEPVDSTQLAALLRWLNGEGVAWRAIGGGSNILVTSRYHEGVFIRLRGSVHDLRTEPASPDAPSPSPLKTSRRAWFSSVSCIRRIEAPFTLSS